MCVCVCARARVCVCVCRFYTSLMGQIQNFGEGKNWRIVKVELRNRLSIIVIG